MACLTAGMLGCGGGPQFFFPLRCYEAARFLLELRMRLFTNPSRPDGGREHVDRHGVRMPVGIVSA